MRTLIVWLGVWLCILQCIGANGWRRRSLLPSLLLSGGGGECTDDVCSIGGPVAVALDQEVVGQSSLPPSGTPDAPDAPDAPDIPDDIEERTAQLVKLGWPQEAATRALHESKYDVTEAANLLYAEEDAMDALREKAKLLGQQGWSDDAAFSALRECNGNETAAVTMLESEEEAIQKQFQSAVADMLSNGWNELVARRALLAQWTLDQRTSAGANTTVAAETLAEIRPTLRRSNVTEPTRPNSKVSPDSGAAKKPTPAKHEDCVFQVTSQNFQKIVLESPVPVLLDCYADWCGPCKQLTPLLENAAMQSGGMFRLAKVNSDAERSIVEALQVQGLPTVFSVSQGKFTDRFVGMLQQDDLQAYLVRALTGYGRRVQADISESQLEAATSKLTLMAGLAALSGKQREKIRALVDEALGMEGGVGADGSLSASIKTALLYIGNAAKSIRDAKFRSISCASKAFVEKVAPSPAARQLLDVAGFRASSANTSANSTASATTDGANGPATLTLIHSNAAILTLLSQRAVESAQKVKFASIKQSSVELGENPSLRKKGGATAKAAVAAKNPAAPRVSPPASTDSKAPKEVASSRPAPAPAPVAGASPMKRAKPSASSSSSSSGKAARKTGTHTLLSTNPVPDKKGNEWFGGDSTLTLAKEDDDEEEGDDDDEGEEEEEEVIEEEDGQGDADADVDADAAEASD